MKARNRLRRTTLSRWHQSTENPIHDQFCHPHLSRSHVSRFYMEGSPKLQAGGCRLSRKDTPVHFFGVYVYVGSFKTKCCERPGVQTVRFSEIQTPVRPSAICPSDALVIKLEVILQLWRHCQLLQRFRQTSVVAWGHSRTWTLLKSNQQDKIEDKISGCPHRTNGWVATIQNLDYIL